MKKLFFTLMMVLLATLAAQAADPINVAGKDCKCDKDYTYTSSDITDLKSGTITYTKSTNTLTLTNVTITRTGSNDYCIHNRSQKGLIVKFVGTASVTVTMLTVFLFLAPSVGKGWMKTLLTGRVSDFFMHLVTPLLAIFSLCVFERWEISLPQCLWGMAPVILYGALYIYKTIILPEGKGWEDFYGFNRGGKWPASLAAMTAGTFLICLGLRTVVIL